MATLTGAASWILHFGGLLAHFRLAHAAAATGARAMSIHLHALIAV